MSDEEYEIMVIDLLLRRREQADTGEFEPYTDCERLIHTVESMYPGVR
jgi:hypothetical protein